MRDEEKAVIDAEFHQHVAALQSNLLLLNIDADALFETIAQLSTPSVADFLRDSPVGPTGLGTTTCGPADVTFHHLRVRRSIMRN